MWEVVRETKRGVAKRDARWNIKALWMKINLTYGYAVLSKAGHLDVIRFRLLDCVAVESSVLGAGCTVQ